MAAVERDVHDLLEGVSIAPLGPDHQLVVHTLPCAMDSAGCAASESYVRCPSQKGSRSVLPQLEIGRRQSWRVIMPFTARNMQTVPPATSDT